MSTPAAIQLTDVRKSFGRTEIIRGVSLEIRKGERHAIIGPNGGGKSTLFNLISGKFPVSHGTIALNGEDITNAPPYEINRRGLSRSFQVINIFPRLNVYENVRCSVLWALGYKYSFRRDVGRLGDVKERTEEVLEQIGLTARRHIPAAVQIGITIAGGADVILFDEPTAGMSRSETDHAVNLIRTLSKDKTLVIVEHDMGVVFGLADRISVLVYGEILATDAPEAVRANKAVQEAYLGTVA